MSARSQGIWLAISAAILFGASMPAAKVLTGNISAAWLAALLYLGVGGGFALLSLGQIISDMLANNARDAKDTKDTKEKLKRRDRSLALSDWPVLMTVIVCGGIIAPLCLMTGLSRCSASTASLLLNLEGVLSAAIAWLVFKERCNSKLLSGMLAITCGGIALCFQGPAANVISAHMHSVAVNAGYDASAIFIILACLGWAIDNNFSRKIAEVDLKQVATLKGLTAATVNSCLAVATHASFPPLSTAAALAGVGFLGYGVSLVLFVTSMRTLGAARASAYFATAPFIGAALAVIFLHEPLTAAIGASALLMAVGVIFCLSDSKEAVF
jgi:drug/metabolite transporter (DMT)-like permease